jgi:hypothetical protein
MLHGPNCRRQSVIGFHFSKVSREECSKVSETWNPTNTILTPFWHRQFKQGDGGKVSLRQKQTEASRPIADHSSGVVIWKQTYVRREDDQPDSVPLSPHANNDKASNCLTASVSQSVSQSVIVISLSYVSP